MTDKKDSKPGKIYLNKVAADAVAAAGSSAPQPNTSSTNGKKIILTKEEQVFADRIKPLMSATDKSTVSEGKEWYEAREYYKERAERFKLFYESLGATKDRVYYAIRVYEDSLVKAAANAIPPSIEQEATKVGIELSKSSQKKAVARAIVAAKLTGEPTHKQVISIINKASNEIDEAAASQKKKAPESEEEEILASLNAIFTSSYIRVVGEPKFNTNRETKERTFAGYTKENGEFVEVGVGEWTDDEKAWVRRMQATLKNITGMSGYDTWASGGPDLGCLGRGEDEFTFGDINRQQSAA